MRISWSWDFGRTSSTMIGEGKPDDIFLHLIDHETGFYLSPVHLGHPIPNTGTYSWTVHAMFGLEQSMRSAYLVMSDSAVVPGDPLEVSAISIQFLRLLPALTIQEDDSF